MSYSLKEAGLSARSYEECLQPTAGETHMQQVESSYRQRLHHSSTDGCLCTIHNL